ncbi:histidine kinase [Nocardiopsis composta]|uniref:Putative membrane protein YphA (DoxX/SURF4 family) n=1 Tax=Nocardiopsis composta TaxID=157465 RepID=A0A7W8QSM1_9ACTN|nr:histidine kinase [Nocardiopsis composta]MBB5435404.1 putative membrane protein YphA (DoxX/SURF4 family) [Nocardiopsis composta]
MKWSGSAGRGRLYDAAVLAVRAGAAWVFAGHAVGRPLSWPTSPGAVLAWLELAGAALLAAGVAAPVCGAVLAGLAAAAVPAAAGAWPAGAELAALPSGASPASLALLGAACLLAAVAPGRLCTDRALRRSAAAGTAGGSRATKIRGGDREGSARRPEEAPPLPYPEGRAAVRRPSRT